MSKCVKYSVTPAKDLTVVLYKTAKLCCEESLTWVRSAACIAASTGEVAQGTTKYYIDWQKKKLRQFPWTTTWILINAEAEGAEDEGSVKTFNKLQALFYFDSVKQSLKFKLSRFEV